MEFAKSAVNWGSVPDWIAGIGSVLAFAGLAWGLVAEARRRRKDEQRAAEDLRRENARQARLVYGQIVSIDQERGHAVMSFHNDSDGFVRHIDVALMTPSKSQTDVTTPPNSADLHPAFHMERLKAYFPPRSVEEERVFVADRARHATLFNSHVRLTFTDEEGRRWQRDGFEAPRPIG